MKITYIPEEITPREKANKGCNICPYCGETKSFLEYITTGEEHKGIIPTGTHHWCEGFFKIKVKYADCYTCYTCGAKWESDPYEKY